MYHRAVRDQRRRAHVRASTGPAAGGVRPVLILQRAIGNRNVARLLRGGSLRSSCSTPLAIPRASSSRPSGSRSRSTSARASAACASTRARRPRPPRRRAARGRSRSAATSTRAPSCARSPYGSGGRCSHTRPSTPCSSAAPPWRFATSCASRRRMSRPSTRRQPSRTSLPRPRSRSATACQWFSSIACAARRPPSPTNAARSVHAPAGADRCRGA
jgi:hypothetical protein